jgi:5-methylcytosine-specific restriction endonuclease McrA
MGLHPHHIKYKSAGGEDTLDNLVTLCWKCHRAVHDGFLKVTVHEVCSKFEGSYMVKFERMGGWAP